MLTLKNCIYYCLNYNKNGPKGSKREIDDGIHLPTHPSTYLHTHNIVSHNDTAIAVKTTDETKFKSSFETNTCVWHSSWTEYVTNEKVIYKTFKTAVPTLATAHYGV